MSVLKSVLLVTFVCFTTSGCFLPMPVALMLKPVGYFVWAQIKGEPAEVAQPLSVSDMLAQVRGDAPTGASTEPLNAKSAQSSQSISVAALLANVRAAPPKPMKTLSSKKKSIVVVGTGPAVGPKVSVYMQFKQARSKCVSMGDACDPTDVKMDPNLPLGVVQFAPLEG